MLLDKDFHSRKAVPVVFRVWQVVSDFFSHNFYKNKFLLEEKIMKVIACEHALSSCQSSFSFIFNFFYIHNH